MKIELVAPPFLRDLDEDAVLLASYVAAREAPLARFGRPSERTEAEGSRATTIVADVRAARRAFLDRHAAAVYDQLTDRRTRHLRLPELVAAAAARFPGLLPTPEQMAQDLAGIQADRDGREIDQAVFCAAVLRSPDAGRHLIDAMLRPTPRALELLDGFRRTGRVELPTVLLHRRGAAAYATFRNPDCLNAEDGPLIADLETAVDLVLLDDDVRVGVLRGGPVDYPGYADRRVFSAGINLKELRNGRISLVEFLLGRELGYLNKIQRGLLRYPAASAWSQRTVAKPWAGAVDSFAIGGGMQLTLVLDLVIAEQDAYFSLPAADEGIVPGLANLRLTRLAGARLARRVILQGERIDAAGPHGHLVCDDVVPAAEMNAAVERAVERLSAPAVIANRQMLTLAEEPLDLYREYLAEFAEAQAERAYSEDVLAKVERRWAAAEARRLVRKG